MSGIQTEGSERLDVEAPKKCPCPAACASLWRHSPVSLAMTHMQWLRGQGGHESTDYTQSMVPLCWWVGKPGQSTRARTRTRASMNVRPRHLVTKQQAQDQRKTSRKDKKKHRMINPWKSKRDCVSRVAKHRRRPYTIQDEQQAQEKRQQKRPRHNHDHDKTRPTTSEPA